MAANILITKYEEDEPYVYYHVKAIDYTNQEFFIAVDPEKSILIFYKDNKFSTILGSASVFHDFQEIPGIYFDVSKRVTFQVSKALKLQNLPDDISYISH